MCNPWHAEFSRGHGFKLAHLGEKIAGLATSVSTGPYPGTRIIRIPGVTGPPGLQQPGPVAAVTGPAM